MLHVDLAPSVAVLVHATPVPLNNMFGRVRAYIEAHKQQEDTHCKSGKDLGALEPERMPNAATAPRFKVAENVDGDADECAECVKYDEMRERSERKRSSGRVQRICGDGKVTKTPHSPGTLGGGDGMNELAEGGERERGRESEWRTRRGLEEDLV